MNNVKTIGRALTDGNFIVSREYAWECAYAVHLLSTQLLEARADRSEDLEAFAEWVNGEIDIHSLKRRLETGED